MLTDLHLAPTTSTPEVLFRAQTGRLDLSGESYPENAFEFYRPILEWLRRFLEQSQQPVELRLGLTYLNTSSIKSMMDLLDLLDEAHARHREVTVTWYYDTDNDRALELAEEFREEVSLPFFVVPEEQRDSDQGCDG